MTKTIGSFLLGLSTILLTACGQIDELDELKTALTVLVGTRASNAEIIESPIEGVYQADIGDRVVFISKQGKHILLGDVYDTERKISLSEDLKQRKAIVIMSSMSEDEMIVFAPEKTKRTITIYTDVDCAYCRKLHKEVPILVEHGVKVRYLWYPRTGIDTPSYNKAVSIWCAENQTAAMDEAKLNNKIAEGNCDPNPVASQYKSGQKLGLRGTPTIVIDDGTIISGYRPAKSLLENIGINNGVPVAQINIQ